MTKDTLIFTWDFTVLIGYKTFRGSMSSTTKSGTKSWTLSFGNCKFPRSLAMHALSPKFRAQTQPNHHLYLDKLKKVYDRNKSWEKIFPLKSVGSWESRPITWPFRPSQFFTATTTPPPTAGINHHYRIPHLFIAFLAGTASGNCSKISSVGNK